MIVTRSSGPTSLRMNAAAPGLDGVEQGVLFLVLGEDDDPDRRQLALDPLGRLDAAGAGQGQIHEDDVGRGLEGELDGAPAVVGLADDEEVGLALEQAAHAHPEQGMVVDEEQLGLLHVASIGTTPTTLRTRVIHRTHELSFSSGTASRTTVPASGREDTSSAAPMSSARSRMNCRPKLRRPRVATAPTSNPAPSSRISTTQWPVVDPGRDRRRARPWRACAHSGGLPGPRAAPPSAGRRPAGRPPRRGPSRPSTPGEGRHRLGGVVDRAVQPELVEERRPELADERPDVAELAAEQLAHEPELGPRHPRIAVEDALDVLDLEDRVRQGLGRPVVDLLGETRSLGLLGLDDPHLDVVRTVRRRRRSGTRLESPRSRNSQAALEAAMGELEPGELRLVAADVASRGARRPSGASASRASSAPASAASTALVGSGLGPVGRGDPPAARPALEVRRARRAAPGSGPARRGTPRGSAR